ncbi:bestrophin family protein [Brumimicrobium aurantiacum]|nr:bestrophin family ion channel [Brumimicrobium aurantiacum]
MIKYNPKTWFRHIFKFHKSDTFWTFRYEIVLVAIYAAVISYLEGEYWGSSAPFFSSVNDVFSFIGFAFSLLLVFRINSAYDKWWEGRKHWGALVNNCRNFSLKVKAFVSDSNAQEKDRLYDYMAAFPSSLRFHLRSQIEVEELPLSEDLKQKLKGKKHVPNAIAGELYIAIQQLKKKGELSEEEMIILDKELKSLTDVLGACERIKNTPIPYSYNLFLKKLIFIVVALTPFAFVADLHYWSIAVTVLVFYIFVGLEYISEEIEEPFGTDNNDLPTDHLAKVIYDNIQEIRS